MLTQGGYDCLDCGAHARAMGDWIMHTECHHCGSENIAALECKPEFMESRCRKWWNTLKGKR